MFCNMVSPNSPYVKAAALTVLVMLAGLFVIQSFDNARASDLQRNAEGLFFENEQARIMMLYAELLGSDNRSFCQYLNTSTALHMGKTFELISRMEAYKKNAVMDSGLDNIWKRYTLANAELYLDVLATNKRCPEKPLIPIAFFYSSKCGECELQGQVLDMVVKDNQNVRVFAFPVDSNYAFVEMFKERYGIGKVPAIVINDGEKTEGLKTKEEILAMLKNNEK